MSTIVLLEDLRPRAWRIQYASGKTFSSPQEGTWDDQARLERLGGIQVPLSHDLITQVTITYGDYRSLTFQSPEPTHFFAFTRHASTMTQSGSPLTRWLYTLFGYVTDTHRCLLTFSPNGIAVRGQEQDEPFSL